MPEVLDPDELGPWVEDPPMVLGAPRQLAQQKRRHLEKVKVAEERNGI